MLKATPYLGGLPPPRPPPFLGGAPAPKTSAGGLPPPDPRFILGGSSHRPPNKDPDDKRNPYRAPSVPDQGSWPFARDSDFIEATKRSRGLGTGGGGGSRGSKTLGFRRNLAPWGLPAGGTRPTTQRTSGSTASQFNQNSWRRLLVIFLAIFHIHFRGVGETFAGGLMGGSA